MLKKLSLSLAFLSLVGCGGSSSNETTDIALIEPIEVIKPIERSVMVSDLSTQWEQKDIWDDSSLFPLEEFTPNTSFHPCGATIFGEYVAVVNCYNNRIAVLDLANGNYVNQIKFPMSATVYVNGDYLVSSVDGEKTYYDGNLNQVSTPDSSDLVFHQSLHVNSPEKLSYSGDDSTVGDILIDPNQSEYSQFNPRYSSDALHITAYDKLSGEYKDFNAKGELVSSGTAPELDILNAVAEKHNTSNLPDVSFGYDKLVTYLKNGAWLVVIDDSSTSYVQDAYQYLYNKDGTVNYLGYFVKSSLYIGLSKGTFTTYSSTRDINTNTGEFTNPHYFRQFSLLSGELISEKVLEHSELAPVLYGQSHSAKGLISTSDTYSSVVLLN